MSFTLAANGHSSAQIAKELSVSPSAVRSDLDSVYAKLDAPYRHARWPTRSKPDSSARQNRVREDLEGGAIAETRVQNDGRMTVAVRGESSVPAGVRLPASAAADVVERVPGRPNEQPLVGMTYASRTDLASTGRSFLRMPLIRRSDRASNDVVCAIVDRPSAASNNKQGVPWTDPVEPLAGYERWLESQPLAVSTRRAYRGHVRRFVEFLASWPGEAGWGSLTDAHACPPRDSSAI